MSYDIRFVAYVNDLKWWCYQAIAEGVEKPTLTGEGPTIIQAMEELEYKIEAGKAAEESK